MHWSLHYQCRLSLVKLKKTGVYSFSQFFLSSMSVYGNACTCIMVHMLRSEHNLQKLALFFYNVGPGDLFPVIRFVPSTT